MKIGKIIFFIFLYLTIILFAVFILNKLNPYKDKIALTSLKNSASVESSIEEENLFNQLLREYPRLYNSSINTRKNTIVKDEKYKYVATDGYSVTHRYDENQDKLVSLEKYELLNVSAKQRIINQLDLLFQASITRKVDGKNKKITNLFKISKSEIAQYKKDNSKDDFQSFKIVKNLKGEPVLIFATAGIPRKDVAKTFSLIKEAVKTIEVNDPKVMESITREYLLRVIAGNVLPEELGLVKTMTISKLGAVLINVNINEDNSVFYTYAIASLSRFMAGYRSYALNKDGISNYFLKNRLSDDPIIDQKEWTKQWIRQHQNDIFKGTYGSYLKKIDKIEKR